MSINSLKPILESKSRDELNVLGRRFRIKGYRRLKKTDLVDALLGVPCVEGKLRVTWWDLHHNHIYGGASIVALFLSIAFFVLAHD